MLWACKKDRCQRQISWFGHCLKGELMNKKGKRRGSKWHHNTFEPISLYIEEKWGVIYWFELIYLFLLKLVRYFHPFSAEVVGGGSGKRGKTKDDGPAVNRHRRSSALIPTSSNAKLEKAKRHGSSGCLSKHCSYSSLQLQEVSSPLSLITGIITKKDHERGWLGGRELSD